MRGRTLIFFLVWNVSWYCTMFILFSDFFRFLKFAITIFTIGCRRQNAWSSMFWNTLTFETAICCLWIWIGSLPVFPAGWIVLLIVVIILLVVIVKLRVVVIWSFHLLIRWCDQGSTNRTELDSERFSNLLSAQHLVRGPLAVKGSMAMGNGSLTVVVSSIWFGGYVDTVVINNNAFQMKYAIFWAFSTLMKVLTKTGKVVFDVTNDVNNIYPLRMKTRSLMVLFYALITRVFVLVPFHLFIK